MADLKRLIEFQGEEMLLVPKKHYNALSAVWSVLLKNSGSLVNCIGSEACVNMIRDFVS